MVFSGRFRDAFTVFTAYMIKRQPHLILTITPSTPILMLQMTHTFPRRGRHVPVHKFKTNAAVCVSTYPMLGGKSTTTCSRFENRPKARSTGSPLSTYPCLQNYNANRNGKKQGIGIGTK